MRTASLCLCLYIHVCVCVCVGVCVCVCVAVILMRNKVCAGACSGSAVHERKKQMWQMNE